MKIINKKQYHIKNIKRIFRSEKDDKLIFKSQRDIDYIRFERNKQ
jgi:hypothetical protein